MNLIKRNVLEKIKNHLNKPEITIITGPRQSGKTTLMKIIEKELISKGEKTLFLNLDIEEDMKYFKSQADLLKKIELEIGNSKGYVFIDEIQRKENAGSFLKGIYDMNLSYKFIVSGSGSIELKEKIHESLAGRKRIFELPTVTFEEFVNYKTNYKYENKLNNFFDLEKNKTLSFIEEYMNFGGYPRVILETSLKEKNEIIKEIFQSYIEKDITSFLRIAKTSEFNLLVRILSHLTGKILNFSDLSSEAGISTKTLKEYLWYLQKTYIIDTIRPFFTNKSKELTKSPICYFKDLGLKNYASGEFGNVRDYSFLFQNFVYLELYNLSKQYDFSIHYWRTKDKAEVDFILRKGLNLLPVEVEYKKLKKFEITRAMRSFIQKYQPQEAIVINLTSKHENVLHKTKIKIIPFYEIKQIISNYF
ncbi:ATP-binding protein [Thermosipho ferrireducens]|uniref:ATP-binding protein n=1 Tax=Thermosipho ferrireducens TaxID=2571116 RepID=A0ABX7S7A6_9BACT|nr:ATP-binding protein [Thermosipho ferrireducens]QTA38464.1 ATP-binding protein [Thermosipho ferrireducens]